MVYQPIDSEYLNQLEGNSQRPFLLTRFPCILVWLFWMYNKTVIGFGLRMISIIIQN